MSTVFSQGEVAAHKTAADLWIIVDGDVYDLTRFQEEHPGASIDPAIPGTAMLTVDRWAEK
jgi:hypothetical protein